MKQEQKRPYPSKRSLENLKLNKKPVVWNDQRFESVTAFRKSVGISNGCFYQAMKYDYRIKGHYADYAL